MSVRVEVRDDEPWVITMKRFRTAVRIFYQSRWVKRRYGYYEKPSVLKRRKAKRKPRACYGGLLVRAHFRELFQRSNNHMPRRRPLDGRDYRSVPDRV